MHEISNSCICREIFIAKFVIVEINVMVYPNISCWYFSLIANPRFVYLTTGKEIAKAVMFALFDSVSDRLTITTTKRFSLSDFLKSIFGYSIIEKKRYLTFFYCALFRIESNRNSTKECQKN